MPSAVSQPKVSAINEMKPILRIPHPPEPTADLPSGRHSVWGSFRDATTGKISDLVAFAAQAAHIQPLGKREQDGMQL